jgi:hypothetical protein
MKHVRSENDTTLWSVNFKEGGNFRNWRRNGGRNDIRRKVKEIGCEIVDGIQLTRYRDIGGLSFPLRCTFRFP